MANQGAILREISWIYPLGLSVPIIKVIIAIPTPDKTNPAIAGQKWLPDWAPSAGGKIKFPAPKKIPNNSKPVKEPFRNMCSPLHLSIFSSITAFIRHGNSFFLNLLIFSISS